MNSLNVSYIVLIISLTAESFLITIDNLQSAHGQTGLPPIPDRSSNMTSNSTQSSQSNIQQSQQQQSQQQAPNLPESPLQKLFK